MCRITGEFSLAHHRDRDEVVITLDLPDGRRIRTELETAVFTDVLFGLACQPCAVRIYQLINDQQED